MLPVLRFAYHYGYLHATARGEGENKKSVVFDKAGRFCA